MRKSILSILLILTLCVAGCGNDSHRVQEQTDASTIITSPGVYAYVYIIEKNGYKFAVAVSYHGVSIAQINPNLRAPSVESK